MAPDMDKLKPTLMKRQQITPMQMNPKYNPIFFLAFDTR
jgi:hypothetical protein